VAAEGKFQHGPRGGRRHVCGGAECVDARAARCFGGVRGGWDWGCEGGGCGPVSLAPSSAAPPVVGKCAAAAAERRRWACLRALGEPVAAAALKISAWQSARAPGAQGASAATAAAAEPPAEAPGETATGAVAAMVPPSLPVGTLAIPVCGPTSPRSPPNATSRRLSPTRTRRARSSSRVTRPAAGARYARPPPSRRVAPPTAAAAAEAAAASAPNMVPRQGASSPIVTTSPRRTAFPASARSLEVTGAA